MICATPPDPAAFSRQARPPRPWLICAGAALGLVACFDTPSLSPGSPDFFTLDAGDGDVPAFRIDAGDGLPPDGPGGCQPSGEICDGIDNDCDGEIDESFPEQGPCGIAVGACVPGTSMCLNGRLSCQGAVGPQDEICDGIDNNCDGVIDEGAADVGQVCGEPNECGAARFECRDGARICGAPPDPTGEICNGLDDDCDGVIDNDVPGEGEACGGEVGRCQPGLTVCREGALRCDGVEPAEELCNGLDDDCDGEIDNDIAEIGQPCAEAAHCVPGVWVCEGELRCEGAAGAARPELCNGLDDDCDGFVDEADPQLGRACGGGLGACRGGALTCVEGRLECAGAAAPEPEICDGVDNDCDDLIDESDDDPSVSVCPTVGQPCGADNRCAGAAVCLNDLGERYCTNNCDPGRPGECPPGFLCSQRAGGQFCLRDYPLCEREGACEAGLHCQLVPARAPDVFGAECRPPLAGGEPIGGICDNRAGDCATGVCLVNLNRCSALCAAPGECGAGFECARTPFRLGNGERRLLGLCLVACGGDADCDGGRLCQYGLNAAADRYVGFCDVPFQGVATGQACDLRADPPITCDHGFCRNSPGGAYCTQGCAGAPDCPEGWACEGIEIPTAEGNLPVDICVRP